MLDDDLGYAIGVTVGLWDTGSYDNTTVPKAVMQALDAFRARAELVHQYFDNMRALRAVGDSTNE